MTAPLPTSITTSMCPEKSGTGAYLVKHGFNMRLLLALLILGSSVIGARAASPSFSSFSQTNFVTNGLFISLRLTNTFGTLYVTNIYITTNRTEILVAGNTYITNLYVTNLYSTNIVINGTNAASQGDLVWTNVAGVIQPRPLQITNALTFKSGSANNATNTAFVIDVVNQWTDVNAGLLSFRDRGTNVGYVTPFGGYMSGRSTGQINPADTDVFIGVRDIAQGETGTAGFWIGAYDDASSPTNFGYAYLTANGGPGQDFMTFNMAAEDTNDASFFRVNVGSSSGVGRILLVQRSATNFAVFDNSGYSGTGTNFLRDDGTYGPAVGGSDGTNTTVLQLGPFTPTYLPVADGTNTLTDSPVHIASAGNTNVIFDGAIYVGTNSYAFWGDSDYSIVSIHDIDGGEPNDNGIAVWTVSGNLNGAIDGNVNTNIATFSVGVANGNVGSSVVWTGAQTNLFLDGQFGTNNPSVFRLHPTVEDLSANAAYIFDTPTWQPKTAADLARFKNAGTNLLSIGPTGQIIFGPGTTNVLYRNGTSLVYQNGYAGGTTNEMFALRNGITNRYVFMSDHPSSGGDGLRMYGQNGTRYVTFGVKSDGSDAHVTGASGGGVVWISPSAAASGSYAFLTSGVIPDTDGKALGTLNNPWSDLSLTATNHIYGHRSGTAYTNYSRIAFSHTGTNGFANFDSQSANDAGGPRAFNFQIGATNIARIDRSAAAGETRFWIYDEDNATMERVTVGAPDSGGVGYKVLRIPN